MKLKTIYMILCLAGLLLPYSQLIPRLLEHGLNPDLFIRQLFENRISAFFAMDVFVSAAAAIVFIFNENSRLRVGGSWLPVAALLMVGVSLALPLFLFMRETTVGEHTET
jgi:hypothetical protein